MTEIKKSKKEHFRNKRSQLLFVETKNQGKEQGAVIENVKENYPKTGNWKISYPEVSEKCVGCNLCINCCPEGIIYTSKLKLKREVKIDLSYCKGCGLCEVVCPMGAIKMKKE